MKDKEGGVLDLCENLNHVFIFLENKGAGNNYNYIQGWETTMGIFANESLGDFLGDANANCPTFETFEAIGLALQRKNRKLSEFRDII